MCVCVCVCVCVCEREREREREKEREREREILIQKSVYGHLGSFCVLAIVNSAAVNTGVVCIFLS